ncbi:GspE/PulE family protein [Jatrophihabitans sp. YIM 134969]
MTLHHARPLTEALRRRGVDSALLTEATRRAADTGKPLRDVLVDDRVVTELDLVAATGDVYGMTAIDLVDFPLDDKAMEALPRALVTRHRVIGIAYDDGELLVAVTDPDDVMALDDVRASSSAPVRPVVVARTELDKILDRVRRDASDLADLAASAGHRETSNNVADLDAVGEEAPVIRYVNSMLDQAIRAGASDIHIEPTESDLRVRFRIDGVLHEIDSVPRGVQSELISRLKIMSGVDITERRVPQNGRMSVQLGGRVVDLRVATLPTVWAEKIVLRVLDTSGVTLRLEALGFSPDNAERYATSYHKPHGMVLVTGPTGSGKSTTLYATLQAIKSPTINIITVEDPVEYRLPGVNQVQVNLKAGLTFAAVLPAILRSDPDVVLIGEIRDRTTAQLAIEASLTGHLVLSTLHTNDAPSAVTRLVEMGIEPFLVGSSLDCVLAQRLARRLCDWCKESYTPTTAELDAARWPADATRPDELWRPVGCRSCSQTGYRGRIAVHEVMPVSEEIERLTVDRASAHDVKRVALEQGMSELRVDGLRKAAAGQTSLAEVLRVAV